MMTGDGQAGRIYCISDIHGCLDALKAALEHIDLSGDGRLVLLGDYIDYGPQSGGRCGVFMNCRDSTGRRR